MQHLLLNLPHVVDGFNDMRNILIQLTHRKSQYKHTEFINGIPECKNEVWFLQKISIITMRSHNVKYITNIEICKTRITFHDPQRAAMQVEAQRYSRIVT